MFTKFIHFISIILLLPLISSASEEKPLWEYGFGIGSIQYAHYPASNQYAHLILPFPTFQYRGEILRADDQDGGRAYLFKKNHWSLEFSGNGRVPLDSSKNLSRQGMSNIPLVINAGPQIVYSPNETWDFKLSLFPSFTIDEMAIQSNGGLAKVHILYNWIQEFSAPDYLHNITFAGTLSFSATTASQKFNATYYEVPETAATPERPSYEASEGFLENQIAYFQKMNSGKLSVYLGASYSDFSHSTNHRSPLHKAAYNMEYAAGITYVLGESQRKSVPLEETEGIINKQIQRRKDRLIHFR